MSIQKKLRAVIIPLAGICCIAPVTEAKADSNTYKVEGAYEITIPAEVSVDTAKKFGTLNITGSLEAYHNVNVEVASANKYNLVNTNNNSAKVTYNISDSDKKFSLSNEENAAQNTNLTKNITLNVSGSPSMSGQYTDVLTFTLTAEDKTPSHTLTFDLSCTDESASTSVQTKTVKQGSTYGELPSPTRDGYTFQGWFTDKEGGTQITKDSPMGEADTTVYARWRENKLTIIYHADGATKWYNFKNNHDLDSIENDIMYIDNEVTYASKYWNSGTAGLVDVTRLVKKGYTGTTYWKIGSRDSEKKICDASDHKAECQIITNESTGAQIAGYLGVLEQFKLGDVTVDLYPYLQANTYTVKYDANASDAFGATANSSHTYDTVSSLTKNGFAREGYIFAGWNTAADGTGTSYTDGQQVPNLTAEPNAFITLYAQWKEAVTLTFDKNSDDAVLAKTSRLLEKNTAFGELPIPTRAGYTFLGWYTAASDGSDVTADTVIGEEDVTVYAHWRENKLTIVYHAGGAAQWKNFKNSEAVEPVVDDIMYTDTDVTYAAKYWNNGAGGLLDARRLRKTGYIASIDWRIGSADSTNTICDGSDGCKIITDQSTGEDIAQLMGVLEQLKLGDVTVDLYPAFIAKTYTVTYDANASDSSGTTANSSHIYDTAAPLTKNGYTRDGYTFTGWNTNADGTGISYKDEESVKNLTIYNNDTIILYAQWEKAENNTFDAKAQSLDLWEEDDEETDATSEASEAAETAAENNVPVEETAESDAEANATENIEVETEGNAQSDASAEQTEDASQEVAADSNTEAAEESPVIDEASAAAAEPAVEMVETVDPAAAAQEVITE